MLTVHGTAGRVVQTIIRDLTTFNLCVSQSSDQAGHSRSLPPGPAALDARKGERGKGHSARRAVQYPIGTAVIDQHAAAGERAVRRIWATVEIRGSFLFRHLTSQYGRPR